MVTSKQEMEYAVMIVQAFTSQSFQEALDKPRPEPLGRQCGSAALWHKGGTCRRLGPPAAFRLLAYFMHASSF